MFIFSRVTVIFGIKLDYQKLFRVPTIRDMSKYIEIQSSSCSHFDTASLALGNNSVLVYTANYQQRHFLNFTFPMVYAFHVVNDVNIDHELFTTSLYHLLKQHSILRTYFRIDGESIHQEVVSIENIDVSTASIKSDCTQRSLQELYKQVHNQKPNTVLNDQDGSNKKLQQLINATIVSTFDNKTHSIFLSAHHVCMDGYCMKRIQEDLNFYYVNLKKYIQAPCLKNINLAVLHPSDACYMDYCLHYQKQSDGLEFEHQYQYWKQRLLTAPSCSYIFSPKHCISDPDTVTSHIAEVVTFDVDRVCVLNIDASVSIYEATHFQLVLASVCLSLHILNTSNSFLRIGGMFANRSHFEFEKTIGPFARNVFYQMNVIESMSFTEFVMMVKQEVEVTLSNSSIHLNHVAAKMNSEGMYVNKLYNVMLLVQDLLLNTWSMSDSMLEFDPYLFYESQTRNDIKFRFRGLIERHTLVKPVLTITYRKELVRFSFIESFFKVWSQLWLLAPSFQNETLKSIIALVKQVL